MRLTPWDVVAIAGSTAIAILVIARFVDAAESAYRHRRNRAVRARLERIAADDAWARSQADTAWARNLVTGQVVSNAQPVVRTDRA